MKTPERWRPSCIVLSLLVFCPKDLLTLITSGVTSWCRSATSQDFTWHHSMTAHGLICHNKVNCTHFHQFLYLENLVCQTVHPWEYSATDRRAGPKTLPRPLMAMREVMNGLYLATISSLILENQPSPNGNDKMLYRPDTLPRRQLIFWDCGGWKSDYLPSRQLTAHWQPTMPKYHKESDFHLPQSQNCLLGMEF